MTSADIHRVVRRHRRRATRLGLSLAACAALAGVAACGSESGAAPADEGVEQIMGSIRVPLVTPRGDAFRLRGAVFDVTRQSGASVTTLDSESDPEATSLGAELDTGAYLVTLRDGWSLERLGDAGGPVSAALLTQNPLPFQIENGRVTEVVYTFSTDSGVISFGSGNLSVTVDVAPNAPAFDCDLLDAASCPPGLACLFSSDTERTYCAAPGSLPVGSPCSSEQCVAGAQCLAVEPSQPEARTCTRFCAPERSNCGCRSLAFDDGVGICTDRGQGQGATFGFTADNCAVVDHDLVTGDDRGGIAVGRDFVHYSGDLMTGRFDVADLAGGLQLALPLDGLVSDLDSGALYSLSVDGSPLTMNVSPCGSGSAFTSLIELEPVDGSVRGAIPLTQPVPYDCGSGVLAGSGFVVIVSASEVFAIETASGAVTNLGPRPTLFPNSCESWAFWGVAERVDAEYRLLYMSASAIMRSRLDGSSEVVANFTNVSDMCSFSISKPLQRWYFHHEATSQFGGFSETLGYCDALIE